MKLIGLKETVEGLKELDRTTQRRLIRKAQRPAAKLLQSAARAEAPEKTGNLKKQIKIKSGRTRGGTKLSVGFTNFIGKAYYAAFILLGWKHGSRKLGNARKSIPANDFLGRAYEANKEAAAELTGETLGQLIEDEWKRGG